MRRFALIICSALFTIMVLNAERVPAEEHRHVSVCLDPHYGGRDNGPALDKKYRGKDVTLDIARAIQQELSNDNITSFLSREDDTYIPRGDRWFFAKKKGADLYLSIRLVLQDRDCVQLYHAAHQPGMSSQDRPREAYKGSLYAARETATRDSFLLSDVLLKCLKNNDLLHCCSVHTKADVLFETADFPAVIIEFGIARAQRQHSYMHEPANRETLAKSIAAAIKEFIEVRQP